MPEGKPTTKPLDEDAAHFLVRMVRKYPHEITIYAGGPMTNLALAISIDPEFAGLAKELVFMGGSLNPKTDDPEFANTPRHEFNLWFDPEAAHIVLTAPWKKIVCTTVDISVKTRLTKELIDRVKAGTVARGPLRRHLCAPVSANTTILWDELAAAAWLDPSLDHGKGHALSRCRSQPRRRLRKYSELDRARQTEDRRTAGRDAGRSGHGEVLQDVRRSADSADAEAVTHYCNCSSICFACG